MARVVKNADVRRNEILDAALRLFVRHGYDATTVNALIEAVGISKGAFYHHFESKEEVMQALARRLAEQLYARVAPLVTVPGLSPIEKLNVMFDMGAQFKKENVSIAHAMTDIYYREENLRLRTRMVAEMMAIIGPLFARILDEGQRDGTFDIEHPVETARLILHLGTFLHDTFGDGLRLAERDLPAAVALFRRRAEAYARAVERILGLGPRTLNLGEVMDDETLALFLRPEKPHA